jgi:anti-anti-sigma regulatory factor
MNIKKHEPEGDEIVVELEGSLSGDESVRELEGLLSDLEQSSYHCVVLNCLKVPAINSSNLGKLFLFFNKLRDEGRQLKIKGCSDTLFKTFQLIEMEHHIPYEREVSPS